MNKSNLNKFLFLTSDISENEKKKPLQLAYFIASGFTLLSVMMLTETYKSKLTETK